MWPLVLAAAASASPTLEVYGARTTGWEPFTYTERTPSGQGWDFYKTPAADRGPVHFGGGTRLTLGRGPRHALWTLGADTHHWGATWSREPTSVQARVHQVGAEVGLQRPWSLIDDHLTLHLSGGVGPYHQRLARPGRTTLPAWGAQWALGTGLQATTRSGWGVSTDLRGVLRGANRNTTAEVDSVGGSYDWAWDPSDAALELRVGLVVPLTSMR